MNTMTETRTPIRRARLRGMLYIVGLGLADEKDITFRGLEIVKQCDQVFIEAYTSLLSFGLSSDGLSTLENLYGKPVTVIDRKTVEEKADQILTAAAASDVAFLVVGDPFGATTHTDLVVQATKLGLMWKVVPNASVTNADLWITTKPLWREFQFHSSLKLGGLIAFTTRFEKSRAWTAYFLLVRGRTQYEPPRYMSINTAIEQLLEVEDNRGESAYDEDCMRVGFARLGSEDQKIVSGKMKQLHFVDFGAPLHCLVIAGKTHPVDEEMLDIYKINKENDHGTVW